jgi:hypothetical protein
MEQVFQSGGVTLSEAGPAAVRLQLKNYLKTGDSMMVTFNSTAKVLTDLSVNTYLDEKDPITLQAHFQTLPDGTSYAASEALDAPEKQVGVRIQNSNYQRAGQ